MQTNTGGQNVRKKKRKSEWVDKRGGFVPRPGSVPGSGKTGPGGSYERPPRSNVPRTPDNFDVPSRKYPYTNFEPIRPSDGRPDNNTGRPDTSPETEPKPKASGPRRRVPVQVKVKEKEKEPFTVIRRRPIIPGKRIKKRERKDIDSKRIYPSSAGSSYSTVRLRVPRRIRMTKWPKGFKTFAQPQQYYAISSTRVETSVGQQNVYVYNFNTSALLSAISGLITTNSTNQYIMKNSQVTYTMTNNSNCNMFVEVWDGYYRRNINNSANNLFQNGLIDEGGSSTTIYQWGLDPLKSLSFRINCKVKSVRRIELMEGRSHQHRVYTTYGSRWSQEYYNNNTTTYLDGWSRFTMFIVRGAPVNEKGAVTNVSTGKVAMDLVSQYKTTYTYITPTTQVISVANVLPTLTTPELLNVATGTAADDTTV